MRSGFNVYFNFSVTMKSEKSITENQLMKTVEWAYRKSVDGAPGLSSASELAQNHMDDTLLRIEQANALIRWQNTKAATSGFITGLGGIVTLPVTIPVNISSVLYVQIRMIAAIAHLGGFDLDNDKVRSLASRVSKRVHDRNVKDR